MVEISKFLEWMVRGADPGRQLSASIQATDTYAAYGTECLYTSLRYEEKFSA